MADELINEAGNRQQREQVGRLTDTEAVLFEQAASDIEESKDKELVEQQRREANERVTEWLIQVPDTTMYPQEAASQAIFEPEQNGQA